MNTLFERNMEHDDFNIGPVYKGSDIKDYRNIKCDLDVGGAWFATDPEYAETYTSIDNVGEYYLKDGKYLNLSEWDLAYTAGEWLEILEKQKVDISGIKIDMSESDEGIWEPEAGESSFYLWMLLNRNAGAKHNIPEELIRQGYIGILAPNESGFDDDNYAVFFPENIKAV